MDNLHPLESKVLLALARRPDSSATLDHLAESTGLEPSQLSMAVEWLLAKSLIGVHAETVAHIASLTPVGEVHFEKYSPIERVLSAAKEASQTGKRLTIQDIQAQEELEPSDVSKAVGTLKKEGAILIVQGGCIESTGRNSPTAESLRALLQELRGGQRELKTFPESLQLVLQQHAVKRGNAREPFRIDERVTRSFLLTSAGRDVTQRLARDGVAEEVSQLTPELLKEGAWRTKRFRKYTISLRAPRIAAGKRHPYREFLDLVKFKLVSMGFQEMRGTLVETEFWNMDALFMPQFHPARDIHDVYFVKEPTHARTIAEPYLTQVTQVHEKGAGAGSTGWGYTFDVERAKRLVLRSQGTAVSARTLAGGAAVPGKYFSIARCFRYDQVDATHATDFFQVEGIVLGEDINFRTLLGLLNLFAREVAQAKEVKFLPAYFPFTEPSVEMHVRHPKLGWMELGGAGLFRPEVTTPLGVSVPVIAWGLGLDRMAMVALGIHDIRDLFSADLDFIRTMRGSF
ncbi:MAG: Phenylalanyl-tRNA synthetase alpha chain [Nitrospira sp.]|jgi:phenylalanyl-tRNA synthetase alpha chain|nr:MAG: Phenylalanyl-tRNA synthetase alpha chain [Nitrospira sp.]